MLVGEKLKYYGIILALSFGSFIIIQQAAIFTGLMSRTYSFIGDTSQADIWVTDPKVELVEDPQPLKDTDLFRVKSVDGVSWAVPLFRGKIKARLRNGEFTNCTLIGLDDSTLIGGPPGFVQGSILDLKKPDAVIISQEGIEGQLAITTVEGEKEYLRLGDAFELNDRRAVLEGICKITRVFLTQPVIYTTYSRAITYTPPERKLLSFILVKAKKGENLQQLCQKIQRQTGLAAYVERDFENMTLYYYLNNTGIPLNFGIAVLLGFIIGTAISGQTFYNFILDNVRYLAVFKALGASNRLLIKMTLLQIAWVGMIGWGLGVGSASLFGFVFCGTNLSFMFPWQLFYLSAFAVFFICALSSIISLRKIMTIDPVLVFKS